MLIVHLRINDAATGQPAPVRINISGPDGTSYAPLGLSAEFPVGRNEDVGGRLRLGPEAWYYIDGACEIALPAGVPLRIRAARGPEFTPLDTVTTLGAGQISLRFAITRWTDARADGWSRIDARCAFIPPHAAILEAAAEDIDLVNLLVMPFPLLARDGHTYTTTPNLHAFSGQSSAIEHGGRSVVVNTLNAHPVLGTVALLHSHRPIFPLTFGGPESSDDWSICDWCVQCHRKGGLAVWVDAFEPAAGLHPGEALAAAILGKIDALEVSATRRATPLLPWVYRLWDAGFAVPLVGASGKESNRVALGMMRTYVRLAGASWVEAVRAGRTYVTEGPLLELERDGDQVRAALRASASPVRVELVSNGRVIADGEGAAEARLAEPGWVAARCLDTGRFAHTSPQTTGRSPRQAEARLALESIVLQTREWIETAARFANLKRKTALLAHCSAAIDRLNGAAE